MVLGVGTDDVNDVVRPGEGDHGVELLAGVVNGVTTVLVVCPCRGDVPRITTLHRTVCRRRRRKYINEASAEFVCYCEMYVCGAQKKFVKL